MTDRDISRTAQFGMLVANFCSALFIITCNKAVIRAGFSAPVTLSLIQYIMNYGLLRVFRAWGKIPFSENRQGSDKKLPWKTELLALSLGLATPVSNVSLKLNSIGVYTMGKLLVTPAIVAVEYFLRGKQVSLWRGFWLLCVGLGVGGNSIMDLEANAVGTIVLALWLPLAVTYKVGWSMEVQRTGKGTLELMYDLFPRAIMWMFLFALIYEFDAGPASLKVALLDKRIAGQVVLSGIAAFAVNFTGFQVMGLISPLAHVVLGQAKSVIMLLIGVAFLGYKYSADALASSLLAMFSIVMYTSVTLKESKNNNTGS